MIEDMDNVERIDSEVEDDYSDDSLFNISSWGGQICLFANLLQCTMMKNW